MKINDMYQRRKAKGLTQQKLAQLVCCSEKTIYKAERGDDVMAVVANAINAALGKA